MCVCVSVSVHACVCVCVCLCTYLGDEHVVFWCGTIRQDIINNLHAAGNSDE